MGMFDNLYINTNKLPVTEAEKKILGESPGWQTKDFECMMTSVYITDDDELKIDMHEWAWDENCTNAFGTKGGLITINHHLETIQHHGYVNFYTYAGLDWYEFNAKFTNGKLESIKGGKRSL